MKRRLLALNVILLALCALAVWRFSVNYRTIVHAERDFLAKKEPPPPVPVVTIQPPAAPLTAAQYLEVADQDLFVKDRNPTVVIDVPPPKPMPVFPRCYGLVAIGGPPKVILATQPGTPQKLYAEGSTVGEFKVLKITQAGVLFEWDGKRVGATYAEMKDTQAQTVAQTQAEAPAAAAAPSPGSGSPVKDIKPASTFSANANKPGAEITPNLRECNGNDSTAAGTVVDGFRKVVRKTPFGEICTWEKAN